MTDRELLELKGKIEKSKEDLAQLKGEKKALMKQLLQEFGCSSIPEAKKRIEENDEAIKKLEVKKEKAVQVLEEEYDF